MKLSENAKIAIVRLSALGDVCHTMSVVSAIQKRYPKAEITWITGKQEAKLVNMLPNVTTLVYEKKTGFKGMLAIYQQLKKHRFDVLLHMQWSIRASLLTRMLKAKIRIGFCRAQSREKQHWFVNHLAPEPKERHVLDALMSHAQAIDAEVAQPFWNLSEEALSLDISHLSLPDDYIVVNPSASSPVRNWTVEGYRAVIHFLLERQFKVVLTGGPAADEVAFAGEVAQNLNVLNLVGKTGLEELTLALKNATLLISPDTGPAHIATMVDTPVIGLYAMSNPERTGPYLSQDLMVSVYAELAEKEYEMPIDNIPWASRVHDEDAMKYISVDMVLEKLTKQLQLATNQ